MRAFILILFSGCLPAMAYMPPGKMILERTVENSGHGAYILEQEVHFPSADTPVIIKETWWIESDQRLRLQATSSFFNYSAIYSANSKTILQNGKKESFKLSTEFPEKIFFYRQWDKWGQELIDLGIIPVKSFLRKALPRKAADFKYEEQSFLRYSRTGGFISYAFGSVGNAAHVNSGLWIEQDTFLIRKIIWPSQIEMTAENYANFAKGLSFPKNRQIQWSAQSIQIKLLQATAKNSFAPDTFSPNQLKEVQTFADAPKSVIEFYNKFR